MHEQPQATSSRQPSEASSTIISFEKDTPPPYEAASFLDNSNTTHNTSKPKSVKPNLDLFNVSDFEDNN